VTVIAVHFSSIPLMRFVLRILPLAAGGQTRWGIVVSLGGVLVGACTTAVWAATQFDDSTMSVIYGDTRPLIVLNLALLTVVTAIRILQRHLRPPHTHSSQYVLFLRKFTGFADRSILLELLRSVPHGVPLLLVGGPARDPAAWDPLLLCFAGLRLRAAVSTVPIFISTTDKTWQEDVAALAASARCVVIDATQASPSMAWEIDLARRLDSRRVVWLVSNDARESGWTDHVVPYSKSWAASVPRIGVGIGLGVLAVVLVKLLLTGGGVAVESGNWSFDPEFVAALTSPWAAALALVIFAPLFLRPTLARAARRHLRHELRLTLGHNIPPAAPSQSDSGSG